MEANKEPFDLDPRFGQLQGGHRVTMEELKKSADATDDLWREGANLDLPSVNRLKAFVKNASLEDVREAAQYSRDPEFRKKAEEEFEDIRQEKVALEFMEKHPEYEASDWNYNQLTRYLRNNELAFTLENLETAYQDLLASGHISTARDQVKPLADHELLHVARLAQNGRVEEAIGMYLHFALPFVNNEKDLMFAIMQPEYLELSNDAVYFTFIHAVHDYVDSDENWHFIERFANGRPFTYPLLVEAWKTLKSGGVISGEAAPQPETPDFDSLSNQEIESAFHATLRERARQVKG